MNRAEITSLLFVFDFALAIVIGEWCPFVVFAVFSDRAILVLWYCGIVVSWYCLADSERENASNDERPQPQNHIKSTDNQAQPHVLVRHLYRRVGPFLMSYNTSNSNSTSCSN